MTEFVNPVYPNRSFFKNLLHFNSLYCFLNVITKLHAGLNCQASAHNFVHKLKIDAAAGVFNNPVFVPMSSLFGG